MNIGVTAPDVILLLLMRRHNKQGVRVEARLTLKAEERLPGFVEGWLPGFGTEALKVKIASMDIQES